MERAMPARPPLPRDHWHLRGLNWLSTLTTGQAAAVRRASRVREYRPGEGVFRPTRTPRYVYLLEKGLVRIFRVSPDGDELTVGYVRPGEIFGEVSVMTGRPRESFAEATQRATLLEIPKSAFLRAVQSTRPLYEVTKQIGLRLIRWQSRVEDLVFYDARTRLARVLLRLAEEFGGKTNHDLAVGLPLTEQEIATLIGTTRQTVSIILSEMLRAGVVVRRARELVVADSRALRALARA
jgi:CRP/FNR family cyclic AMP-dependent transcriptional regulator